MTNDGHWAYSWDGENRLTRIVAPSGIPTGARLSLNFSNDWYGRRISKVVSNWTGSAWAKVSESKFLYDGWNLVAVLDDSNTLLYSFRWGSDLSGTMQGAGGVGGLVAMTVHTGGNAGTYFCAYDGNGNVAALINAADGTVAARYEYGPFLEVIRATGPLAFLNPFRASTKYQDDETGFLYYGYRYYDPSTGRWLSRDPIGEPGHEPLRSLVERRVGDTKPAEIEQGPNLFAFVRNSPVSWFDTDGRALWGPPFFPPPPPTPPSGKTLYYWTPTPCPKGQITAFIQVGLGGSTFYPKPFVDDGTHGPLSASPVCPPLYPASSGGAFADEPGNALGTVGLNGLTFEVCRVCLVPCCAVVNTGRIGPMAFSGLKIVSIGPCVTYTLPGTGKDTDLGAPGGGTASGTPSGGFGSALDSAYPGVKGGGCFKCSLKDQSQL